MKQFVLAALLGASQSYKLNHRFATGMNGDEDLGQNIIMKGDKYHYNQEPEEKSLVQTVSFAAAQEGSGVRARWVELPDCPSAATLSLPEIVLKEDLSNAIIATCKVFRGIYTTPPAAPADTSRRTDLKIYDPVIHPWKNIVIPNEEHQVT